MLVREIEQIVESIIFYKIKLILKKFYQHYIRTQPKKGYIISANISRVGSAIVGDMKNDDEIGKRTVKTAASVASGWGGGALGAVAGNSGGAYIGEIFIIG
jgi:DNA-binding winged helix-turn-helix (wHTH) protein